MRGVAESSWGLGENGIVIWAASCSSAKTQSHFVRG